MSDRQSLPLLRSPGPVERLKGDGRWVVLLILVFAIIELIIDPRGEFPLNDDWSYTRSLQHLYQTGQLRLEGFTSMPLVAQLGWGLLFCKIFGFSFTVVRISTLVLALAGVIASYYLIRGMSAQPKTAFAGALMVMLNPIFLNLSNTYMTDVPFMSLLIVALYFFVRVLKGGGWAALALGIVFVTASTMVRQLGILAAFCFAVCYAFGGDREGSLTGLRRWLAAGLTFLVPLAVYMGYNHWLKVNGLEPIMYHEGTKMILFNLFYADYSTPVFLAKQLFNIFMYIGFFIFPWVFIIRVGALKRSGGSKGFGFLRGPWAYFAAFVVFALGYFAVFHRTMPYTGNILGYNGLGIYSLRDFMILKHSPVAALPAIVRVLITLLGAIGGGLMCWMLVRYVRDAWRGRDSTLGDAVTNDRGTASGVSSGGRLRWFGMRLQAAMGRVPVEVIFLLMFMILYLGVMWVGGNFDRYLIPMIPVCGALIAWKFGDRLASGGSLVSTGRSYGIALGVVMIYGIFSVGLTQEYFSWNRARWTALRELMGKGVTPAQIDGGFEFDGYYNYDDSMMRLDEDPHRKSWWWVKDDEWLLAFGPVEGYRLVGSYPYHSALPGRSGNICVLKKVVAAASTAVDKK